MDLKDLMSMSMISQLNNVKSPGEFLAFVLQMILVSSTKHLETMMSLVVERVKKEFENNEKSSCKI